jgi:hypothetical protein
MLVPLLPDKLAPESRLVLTRKENPNDLSLPYDSETYQLPSPYPFPTASIELLGLTGPRLPVVNLQVSSKEWQNN